MKVKKDRILHKFSINIVFYDRHGESWLKFRSKVQQPLLQPRVAKLYCKGIEETAQLFVSRQVYF